MRSSVASSSVFVQPLVSSRLVVLSAILYGIIDQPLGDYSLTVVDNKGTIYKYTNIFFFEKFSNY